MNCTVCGNPIVDGRGLIVGSLPMGRGVKVVVDIAYKGGTHCTPECAMRSAHGYVRGMYDTVMEAGRPGVMREGHDGQA